MKTLASIGLGILLTATVATVAPAVREPSFEERAALQEVAAMWWRLEALGAGEHFKCLGTVSDPRVDLGPAEDMRERVDEHCASLKKKQALLLEDAWRACTKRHLLRIGDPDGLVICP